MSRVNAFDDFASRVLKTYHEGEEEFWDAVMAPFLSDTNVLTMWKHHKIGLELMDLIKSVDSERKKYLTAYTLPLGFDISKWKSLNMKDEYFKDAYPIYAFLVIWMEDKGLVDNLKSFGDLLRAVVYGIAGYGILDVNVDGKEFSAVELLTAQTLIAEYETLIFKTFGVSEVNLNILHQTRNRFFKAEIKEKFHRGKGSPYEKDKPIECGFKAAHLLTPFMLSLEQLGKSNMIDAYFEVFFLFGAVIQILDDLKDLEDDISIGHFSYATLDSDAVVLYKEGRKPKEIAKILLKDNQLMSSIYITCKKLISNSNEILIKLDDPFLAKIVYVTELRLDSYFKKDLKIQMGE